MDSLTSILSGGFAGLAVDSILFPLDTIKTRMQHSYSLGKFGFRNLYAGISPSLLASIPSGFFLFIRIY
jgi:solute carrier family 25 S-adenosylmethionine transporter 26